MDYGPTGSSLSGDSPGKNIEMCCCALLQGIFLTQGLNQNLLYLLQWHAGSLLLPLQVMMYIGTTPIKIVWRVLKKLKLGLP